jgi:hypothetical protein
MMQINYDDRYLRTYAARYRHPVIGKDSIWRVASYLNLIPPGVEELSPEIAEQVVEILNQVVPDENDPWYQR